MQVYYSGAGAWCRATENNYFDTASYIQLTSPSFVTGVFELPDAAQQGIKYNQSTEVTYLLPCRNHEDAASSPSDEDTSQLIFQLYAQDNELSEKVYHENDVINLKSNTPEIKSKTEHKVGQKNSARLIKMIQHLKTLEETARAKEIPFDKNSLGCSKAELLKWLQSKPGSHFKIKPTTFSKVWTLAKDYKFCPPASKTPNFFENIQG